MAISNLVDSSYPWFMFFFGCAIIKYILFWSKDPEFPFPNFLSLLSPSNSPNYFPRLPVSTHSTEAPPSTTFTKLPTEKRWPSGQSKTNSTKTCSQP